MHKSTIAILLIIATSIVVAITLYPIMPDQIASHWNASGEVNGHMGKFWGLFLMPIISIILFALFLAIPKIDPLKENVAKFRSSFDRFIVLIELFLFYVYALTIFWNLDFKFDMTMALIPALVILFYFAGNLIGKAKRNYFIGIRTPWTLASDEVWDKTHKLGGKLFKIAGVASLAGLLFPKIAFYFVIIPILAVAIISVVYSYIIWKKGNDNAPLK